MLIVSMAAMGFIFAQRNCIWIIEDYSNYPGVFAYISRTGIVHTVKPRVSSGLFVVPIMISLSPLSTLLFYIANIRCREEKSLARKTDAAAAARCSWHRVHQQRNHLVQQRPAIE
jgi:hypothetical protein